jgi:biopolymer transport protein TolQ
MLDLVRGETLPVPALVLQQNDIWTLISQGSTLTYSVVAILLLFSVYSWTVIFSKMASFGAARKTDRRFMRAFRKAKGLDAVLAATEQYRPSPLVSVFDRGYEEVSRQVKSRGTMGNREAITRSLQLGVSEQLAALEHNVDKLATIASVSPFIGLLGTVLGIIRAFNNLGSAGSTSLKAVGPGIADALIATAVGLFAAIPAAMAYNQFGHVLKEMGDRMDDFTLEFQNLIERSFGD